MCQMVYAFCIDDITQNTMIAMTTSGVSILLVLLNYFINRDKKGNVFDRSYYFEVKLLENVKDHRTGKIQTELGRGEEGEVRAIKMARGNRLALAKEIARTYDLDVANIEVGYVWIRDDDFVIRVVQRFRENDLDDEVRDAGVLADADEVFTKIAKNDPYQMQCFKLFGANKQEITDIIFNHFGTDHFGREKFQVHYHNEYPKDKVDVTKRDGRTGIIDQFVDDHEKDHGGQGVGIMGGHLLAMHREKMDEAFDKLRDVITLSLCTL